MMNRRNRSAALPPLPSEGEGPRKRGEGLVAVGAPSHAGAALTRPRGRGHPRPGAGGSNRRASVLVLVIVMLALMVLLGAAYLQIARVDREATRLNQSSHIDLVIADTLAELQAKLRDDVVDPDTGRFFDATTHMESYDYPWTNPDAVMVSGNDVNQFQAKRIDGTTTGTVRGGYFDDMWLASTVPDFAASGNATDPKWPHLTNMSSNRPGQVRGTRLDLPLVQTGAPKAPNETFMNGTGEGSDTNVPILDTNASALSRSIDPTQYYPRGADADGDGVPDSYWWKARMFQVGDMQYAIAVRIVDNSALLNVNVATALTSNGQWGTSEWTAAKPRGYWPSDLDLSRLLQRANVGTWGSELAGLLDYRIKSGAALSSGGIPLAGSPWTVDPTSGLLLSGTPSSNFYDYKVGALFPNFDGSRRAAWYQLGRMYGLPSYGDHTAFGMPDELDLRQHNGLSTQASTTPLAGKMRGLLRANASEKIYTDVVGGSLKDPGPIGLYFQGAPDDTTTADARTYRAVRHLLTTRSGAAVWAPNPTGFYSQFGTPAPTRLLKYDLVTGDFNWGANPKDYDHNARVTNVANRIAKVLGLGVAPNRYLDAEIAADSAAGNDSAADHTALGWEFAVNIKDYSDPDNYPSCRVVGTVTYCGLEPLPFLREVYIQAGYKDQDWWHEANNAAGADGKGDSWEFEQGTQAVAIEIGNPFDRVIPGKTSGGAGDPLKNGHIRVLVTQDNAIKAKWQLNGPSLLDDLKPGDKVILISNPQTPLKEPGPPEVERKDLVSDLAIDAAAVKIVAPTTGTLTFGADKDVTIELQVIPRDTTKLPPNDLLGPEDQDTSWITYDRLTIKDFKMPAGPFDHKTAQKVPPAHRHGQASLRRFCNPATPWSYLSNVGKTANISNDIVNKTAYDATIDAFWIDIKGGSFDASLANYQICIANRQFVSVAELGWVHMFGFYRDTTAGRADRGDFPQRLTGAETGVAGAPKALDLRRRFLDFDAASVVPTNTTDAALARSLGIPHAALLLDQFTTLSPANDNEDNDGDGNDANKAGRPETNIDGPHEQLVPGLININTVPPFLFALIAPLPEPLIAPLPEKIGDIEALARAIADYRDNPANRVAGTDLTGMTDATKTKWRQEKGISHLAELMFLNPKRDAVTGEIQDHKENMQRYRGSFATKPDVDLFPIPEEKPVPPDPPRRLPDSPRARLARYQFLSQCFTTRSDVYTAYVIVRGYSAGKWNEGPYEQARFVVVFDRSGVTNNTDPVRILGFYRIQ